MTARDEILARIRAAKPVAAPVIAREYRPAGSWAPDDVAALFAERLTEYQARLLRCRRSEVAATITEALSERAARKVVVPQGFPEHWLPAVPQVLRDDPPLAAGELDDADAVVTTCALAIAETGTLVLDAQAGQGRRALSLLPDYHLVVLTEDQIVAGVPDAVTALDPSRPLTWISGPSATSDIELNRVEGVHGPRTLDVVLVASA